MVVLLLGHEGVGLKEWCSRTHEGTIPTCVDSIPCQWQVVVLTVAAIRSA